MIKLPFWQALVCLDQLVNTLTWSKHEGFGMADETVSARLYRLQNTSRYWKWGHDAIDFVVGVLSQDQQHCYHCWIEEMQRHHFPDAYLQLSLETQTEEAK